MQSTQDAKGGIRFNCSDKRLEDGFLWAREQALSYVFEGDPVGDWYEAALPGRGAFCMRDVSHQCAGAQALGLARHNKNMLLKFAQGIAQSRDFCSFWEIDRLYRPAPVDYTSDTDFWYNLPANFDVTDACWRMYNWTNDDDYVNSVDFKHFYDLTAVNYVEKWDIDGDGLLEGAGNDFRRGIPSYDEGDGMSLALTMLDTVVIQARGYDSYARLCRCRGMEALASEYTEKSNALRHLIEEKWWDEKENRYFYIRLKDNRMAHTKVEDVGPMPSYYGGFTNKIRLAAELDRLNAVTDINVEGMSYMPGTFYKYQQFERAKSWLLKLVDPELKRREYPEVSFSVIGSYVEGLMGVKPDARLGIIETTPGLTADITGARIEALPVFGGTITVEHSQNSSLFVNNTGRTLQWKARFAGKHEHLSANGNSAAARHDTNELGQSFSYVTLDCPPGQSLEVKNIGG